MAGYYQVTPEEIRASLSQQEGGEANIANSLRTRKAVEALVKNAKITDGEWVDPSQVPVEVKAEKRKKRARRNRLRKRNRRLKKLKEKSRKKKLRKKLLKKIKGVGT